jgi:hypothetical protein
MLFRAVLHQEARKSARALHLWMMLLAIDFTSDMEQAKSRLVKEGYACLK